MVGVSFRVLVGLGSSEGMVFHLFFEDPCGGGISLESFYYVRLGGRFRLTFCCGRVLEGVSLENSLFVFNLGLKNGPN